MPETVHSSIALFADDAKLFSSIKTPSDAEDLHTDLRQLEAWADKWQLRFNAKKCKVMHLGKKNKGYDYKMGDVVLETIHDEKDLGVRIDDQLKFDKHIEQQVKTANKILGLIRRSFDHLDLDTFKVLYKSLVRPILEYCNVVAHPQYERQRKLIEGVQRRATKLVPGLRELGYTERLEKLDIPSMYYRRARGDIIETYKYLHNIYTVDSNPLTLEPRVTTRGHNLKLQKRRYHKPLRKNFYSFRVVNPWNRLPDEVVNAPTINTLKNRLDSQWKDLMYN